MLAPSAEVRADTALLVPLCYRPLRHLCFSCRRAVRHSENTLLLRGAGEADASRAEVRFHESCCRVGLIACGTGDRAFFSVRPYNVRR